MSTNGQRIRQTDAGDPDLCPVGDLHKAFSPSEIVTWSQQGCRNASIKCDFCKVEAAQSVSKVTDPIFHRRRDLELNIEQTWDMLRTQSEKAGLRAEQTMMPVRNVLDLNRDLGSVRRHYVSSEEDRRRMADLSPYADWWNLPSNRMAKLLRSYWRNNLVPYDIALSQEANRTFPNIDRELEEPYLTVKNKRVLVAASSQKPDGWHFRIPTKSYEVWVLLCWRKNYQIEVLVIPQKYYAEAFAKSKKLTKEAVVHLHVFEHAGRWNLSFPDLLVTEAVGGAIGADAVDPVDATELLGNYQPLK
jgi:tryptophanyl-tRNA synthetase